MYLIEGPETGFTSIPVSVYWAVVTLTTVGFGDITPVTPQGQMLAALIMLMGYGLIAIPTGIVSVEFAQAAHRARNAAGQTMMQDRVCSDCHSGGHDQDAQFCKACGGTVVEVTGE